MSISDDMNWDPVDLRRGEISRTHWVKKDGTVMLIADMSDDHLGNALRLVARSLIGDLKRAIPGLLQEWRRRGFQEEGWRR